MNGKIFLVLALVGSLAVATSVVGTTFASKGGTHFDQGSGCKSFENRQNPKDFAETCHSFGHKSTKFCQSPSRASLAGCTKETPP